MNQTHGRRPELLGGGSPLPDGLYLDESAVHGLGIFAESEIKRDTTIGIGFAEVVGLPSPFRGWGGWINHSNTPNVKRVKNGQFHIIIAIRDIDIDEELFLMYTEGV